MPLAGAKKCHENGLAMIGITFEAADFDKSSDLIQKAEIQLSRRFMLEIRNRLVKENVILKNNDGSYHVNPIYCRLC